MAHETVLITTCRKPRKEKKKTEKGLKASIFKKKSNFKTRWGRGKEMGSTSLMWGAKKKSLNKKKEALVLCPGKL